ncbi:OLC1v1004955C1 [Oldenlandia corymbosa var. corymbosa]|uniref:OLC1v1004955C1 n=1 Tax=Oldenlandia corymbosa var. corymbosa TaxID=529605 RepID=A0AAV1DDG9_OLDCO|nr:OLC1v1004955C1 [Oldenlandia corymbosa var. corymbosa]
MVSDHCGSGLLLDLPDDVLVLVTRSLTPKDLCRVGLTCRALCELVASDKVWHAQCDKLGVIPYQDLIEWRKGVSSYKAICRFIFGIQPLLGIWVHQNPELGNVVYIMPGFISVVGCRIIPQELGPLGLEDGPILWAPVFEILCDYEGSAQFYLHGRERESDFVYPGSLKAVDRTCNVLLLEVEPRLRRNGGKLVQSKSFAYDRDREQLEKISRLDGGASKSQRIVGLNASGVPFSRLAFGDRRKLLDIVTRQVGLEVPKAKNVLLFPRLKSDVDSIKDLAELAERRMLLMQMYKLGGSSSVSKVDSRLLFDPTQLDMSEVRKNLNCTRGCEISQSGDGDQIQYAKKKTIAGYFRDSFKNILRKSNSIGSSHEFSKRNSSVSGNKHAQLHEFLYSGDTVGLTLHAATVKLSTYRAWPNMHDSRFALYKLPMREPVPGQEFSGLWGGTFGWPPGKPNEDKLGKALFFLLLSYEKAHGQNLLIATKILEGTHYVLHPNGSAMFIVNIDEISPDTFPWETDRDGNVIDVKNAYTGEGIANGYGFRYPGSKPGSLYVIQDGLLAFVWRESRSVLTLQRLSIENLLKKGERMPALPPVSNFAYLTRSYTNVFAAFSNPSNGQSSQR